MQTIVVILVSYLLGCFCTGYYWVRWRTGQDIRMLGSGNVGAKNVARLLGKGSVALVFLGDMGKGFLAVWLAQALGVQGWSMAATLVAVVLGHLYPVQLGWRGGKGASTGFGALLALQPVGALACLALAGIIYLTTRAFTPSGLVTMAVAPIIVWFLGMETPELVGILLIAGLLLWAHRANIRDFQPQDDRMTR